MRWRRAARPKVIKVGLSGSGRLVKRSPSVPQFSPIASPPKAQMAPIRTYFYNLPGAVMQASMNLMVCQMSMGAKAGHLFCHRTVSTWGSSRFEHRHVTCPSRSPYTWHALQQDDKESIAALCLHVFGGSMFLFIFHFPRDDSCRRIELRGMFVCCFRCVKPTLRLDHLTIVVIGQT
jgi:hypothetical protein